MFVCCIVKLEVQWQKYKSYNKDSLKSFGEG